MAMLQQSFRNVAIRRRVAAYRAFYEDCHGSEERDHYAGRPDVLNEGRERWRHQPLNEAQQETQFPAYDENAFFPVLGPWKHDA